MWILIRLAVRNVARNRRRTLITLVAVLFGVGAAVTTRGVMNGLQQALVTNVTAGFSGALQIHRTGYMANVLTGPLTLELPADEAFLSRVRAVEGVKAVAPRIHFAGSLSAGKEEALVFTFRGLSRTEEVEVCPAAPETFTPGSRFDTTDAVLVADSVLDGFGGAGGQELVLVAPDRDGAINGALVHLTGGTRSVMPGADTPSGVVALEIAQSLLRMEGRATEIAVAVHELSDVDAVAQRLREALGPDYEIHTWSELLPEVAQSRSHQDVIQYTVSVVFLVLLLLGVANAMLMSVMERTREVGTMLAVGMRRSRVLTLFLLEAIALGVSGGGLGALLGLGLTSWLAYQGIVFTAPSLTVPFDVRPFVGWGYLAAMALIATLGAALFSLYPAWRASRLRPVEALAGR